MTTVLLFHHAQGRTTGFLAFADELRAAGHTVHTPDLFDGRTFDDLEAGVAYAREIGFDAFVRRGTAVAEDLPPDTVYAGFSLGVMPAQSLAQQRAGAREATFVSAAFPPSELGGPWPQGVPAQIHMMDADPWADEDRPAAEALVAETGDAELFLYPGSGAPLRRPEPGRLRASRRPPSSWSARWRSSGSSGLARTSSDAPSLSVRRPPEARSRRRSR